MAQLLAQDRRSNAQRRVDFRKALAQPGLIVAPGVFDGLSALVVEEAGFSAVYVSGGAVSRSAGIPDLGILSSSEMRERTREVVRSTDLPVVADADTGYGGIFNVMRTVRELEEIGVAALHLEDQVDPKKCGHYEQKEIIGVEEMCAKIIAATQSRTDEGLVIIARTDAVAVEGLEEALDRGARYREAGADVIFIEALETREQMEKTVARFDCPLLINMFSGGKTPLLTAREVEELGFKLMIVPSDLQRASLYAMRSAARALRVEGSTSSYEMNMATFPSRDVLVGLSDFSRTEAEISVAVRDQQRQATMKSPIGETR